MTVHNKGKKSDRDRAILIASYQEMCKVFKVPRSMRLSTAEIAGLSNEKLYKISKDIYSQATIKQANKLAVKMGLIKKPETILERLARFMRRYFLKGAKHAQA